MALLSPEEAANPALTDQDKRSGYYYQGKEIVLNRPRGRPKEYRNKAYYNQDQKIEAATLYAVYGDIEGVSKLLTNIPPKVLRVWKQEPWWVEVQKQVYSEQNEKLASKLSSTLDKTLEILTDRLENGDTRVNPRTGDEYRVPVDTKTLTSLFNQLAHHRSITRGEPTSIKATIGVDDRLRTLQDAFIKFSKTKTIQGEVIDVKEEEDSI